MSVSSSVVIRHGYTMADIDRISRIAVTCGRWRADMAGADRYTEAHFGIVELLLTADDRPPESELIVAGMRAVDQWVRAEMHHHGWDTRHVEAGAGALPGFCRFWQASGRSPAEERLVERLAVAQVWPRLTFAQQQAVVALAVTGDYVEAAASLGLTRVAFAERLKKARATFGALWFEHETPSRRRRRDKRVLSRSGLMRDGRRLLTESDVDRLRERRAAGVPLRVLAEETGYSAGGLCNLLRGKRRAARDGGGAALGHGCGPRAGGGRLAGRGGSVLGGRLLCACGLLPLAGGFAEFDLADTGVVDVEEFADGPVAEGFGPEFLDGVLADACDVGGGVAHGVAEVAGGSGAFGRVGDVVEGLDGVSVSGGWLLGHVLSVEGDLFSWNLLQSVEGALYIGTVEDDLNSSARGPAVTTTHIRRSITAAIHATEALRYATLSGAVLDDLLAGRVVRVSQHLARRGLDPEFIERYGSPAGRAVAKAHRALTGREPLRCWVRNDAGRYIHVCVYGPSAPALDAGFVAYRRTREYAAGLVLAA